MKFKIAMVKIDVVLGKSCSSGQHQFLINIDLSIKTIYLKDNRLCGRK